MHASQLYEDHRQLDVLFEDLLNRADANQWWLCDQIWDELTERLEAHMGYEEQQVFPKLVAERPGLQPVVTRLLREHDELRAIAFRIGVALQVHEFRPEEAKDLVARLRAHAEEENRTVYPPAALSAA
ncbi:MAG: hemerythrin domain-containing protein [Polyangiaceae bacterium]